MTAVIIGWGVVGSSIYGSTRGLKRLFAVVDGGGKRKGSSIYGSTRGLKRQPTFCWLIDLRIDERIETNATTPILAAMLRRSVSLIRAPTEAATARQVRVDLRIDERIETR